MHGLNKTETDGLCSSKLKENVNLANWAYVWGFRYQRKNPLVPWNPIDVISIAKEDKDLCDYWTSPFLQQICKSIETKKWVDIENEYYDLLSKCALPAEALREVVLNALCHRQYERYNLTIGIAIYDDRIEIENPGILPPQITPENILHHISHIHTILL